jgi:LmbE family N-acetylglucosaminyl deacetylase
MTSQHIFLSPHYDDVALSCGGTIHQLTRAGETVLVATVFAAPPPRETRFSPFAQELHAKWGKPDDVITLRRSEDQAAMKILGADHLWLDFPDCIYRGSSLSGPWFYNSDEDLFGNIRPDDMRLAEKIVESIQRQIPTENGTEVYAPLTVGHHVDHQLVHATAWQLHNQGKTVMFYEDYPYVATDKYGNATLNDTLAWLENQQKPVKPRLQLFSEINLKAKIDSINAYASQVDTLFGNQAAVPESVRQYAEQVGDGQLAERFWIPE